MYSMRKADVKLSAFLSGRLAEQLEDGGASRPRFSLSPLSQSLRWLGAEPKLCGLFGRMCVLSSPCESGTPQ